jgi:hypothetical protein
LKMTRTDPSAFANAAIKPVSQIKSIRNTVAARRRYAIMPT